MKKILVLTDLTENARKAAEVAVLVGAKMHKDIIVLNAYLPTPVMPSYGDTAWTASSYTLWEDNVQEKLNALCLALETKVNDMPAGEFRPAITNKAVQTDLGNAITELLNRREIELIMIGGSSSGTLEHFFFGSDTSTVLRNSDRPVIIIPSNSILEKISKITLATAYEPDEFMGIKYLVRLASALNAELDIVHVDTLDEASSVSGAEHQEFIKHLKRFEYPNITEQCIRGKDVVGRLWRYCKEEQSQILSFVHHRHSLLERIITSSTTKKALSHQALPVIVFPPSFNSQQP